MSRWQLNLVLSKSLAGGTSCEPIRGSWRTADAWHFQRSGEAIGECIASVTVECLGLKRSWRKVECVPCGRMRIPKEKSEATVEGAAPGGARTEPLRTAAAVE